MNNQSKFKVQVLFALRNECSIQRVRESHILGLNYLFFISLIVVGESLLKYKEIAENLNNFEKSIQWLC